MFAKIASHGLRKARGKRERMRLPHCTDRGGAALLR